MKSILHISSPISWRGGERQIANLMMSLKGKINQVVLCPSGSPLATFCKANKIEYVELQKKSSFSLSWAKEIKKISKNKAINSIHVHDSKAHTFAVLSSFIFKNKPTIIVSRRVIFPIKTNFFTRYKYTNSKIETIICISEVVERVVLKSYPNVRTDVVKSSINIDKYKNFTPKISLRKQFNIDENAFLVGYVAALSKEKDHFTFIKTAQELYKIYKNIRFVIVGKGKERDIIEEYIVENDLQDIITLIGFIKEIDDVIPQIDLLLFTSVSEGLGSSILDFFLAKKPVVSTSCGGPEELITHGVNGLLSDIGDYKDLAKNVLKILGDCDLTKKITNSAYKYIVDNHSLKQLADKTYTIYNRGEFEKNSRPTIKLTAIIPTLNEETNIEEAIKNIQFADEILIIDSFSIDKTIEIAKKYDVNILQRKFDNFSSQKNFAINKAENDWILILDADERLPNEAIEEIKGLLNHNLKADAYWMKRQNYFLNKKINFSGWQNDKVIKLFNRNKASYDGKFVHEEISCSGNVKYLKSKLLHYTYKNKEDYKNKLVLYSELKAQELFNQGKRPNIYHFYIKPLYRFLYHYILKLGFLDGKNGLFIASVNAYGIKNRYKVLKRLYEKSN